VKDGRSSLFVEGVDAVETPNGVLGNNVAACGLPR